MSWTLSCHLVFLSTAAIVSETSPPTLPSSEHQNRNKNNGKFRAQDLLLKHTAPIFACCWHIQPVCILLRYACRSAACTARMRTVFPPWFSPLIPNRFHLPPLWRKHRLYWYSRRRLGVSAASALQNREACGSGDGDQLSCRRLDRTVFMAAAGRDVCLAPSIQLPSDGFSPCFIIIPIISLGGGSRLPPSSPRCPRYSPFLSSDAIWTQNMPALKTYRLPPPRPSPLWHDAGLLFCLHPLKKWKHKWSWIRIQAQVLSSMIKKNPRN